MRRALLGAAASATAISAVVAQQYVEWQSQVASSANAEQHLPLSAEAQKTDVVLVKKLLSASEVDRLHALHDELKPKLGSAGRNSFNQAAAYKQGMWETTYLSTDGLFG